MASFPEPVEYKIVRNVQSVRTYVTDLDQSNTPMFSPLSPFLTISLCRAGHYFSIQYFRYCAMYRYSVSWGSMSSCLHVYLYVVPPSPFRSASAPSPRKFVLAMSHRCGCVLASSRDQTTLVFCFPGKGQQVLCATHIMYISLETKPFILLITNRTYCMSTG